MPDSGFVLERVPLTNLVMLVVNALCSCEDQKMSIEPEEVPYPPDTLCERLLAEPYRRRPKMCTRYHVGVSDIIRRPPEATWPWRNLTP